MVGSYGVVLEALEWDGEELDAGDWCGIFFVDSVSRLRVRNGIGFLDVY